MLLDISGSGQKASQLCWAATAEMAVNALAGPSPPMSQERQLALAAQGIAELPDPSTLTPTQRAKIKSGTESCEATLGLCNRLGEPILERLSFELMDRPLFRSELGHQIGDLERPVIFSWRYSSRQSTTRPVGQHFLIITGYNNASTSRFLRIWDPWPAREDPHDAKSGGQEAFISYQTYAEPGLDMGLPKEHLDSRTKIRRFPEPEEPPVAMRVLAERAPPAAPRPQWREVPFAEALGNSLSADQRAAILRDISASREDGGRLTVGTPFPVLALHVDDIVANRDQPAKLLVSRTMSVLYPVMSGRAVVDSFLMTNDGGRWVEKGYANTAVTRQLVRWRVQNVNGSRVRERDFFVISVPQYSAFFTSVGAGQPPWRSRRRPIRSSARRAVGRSQRWTSSGTLPPLSCNGSAERRESSGVNRAAAATSCAWP